MSEVILDREKLYELVWSKPMTKIAKDYGMSDNGIRKICRKFNIPTPEAGHWQKVQHGKLVVKKPLPKLKGDSKITINKPEYTKIISEEQLMIPEVAAEYLPKNQIKVLKTLSSPHSLVKEFQKKVDKKHAYRGLVVSPRGALCVKVGLEQLDRALRIMDALIKAFEKRKMEIWIETEDYKSKMFVDVLGKRIEIDLYGRVKNVDRGKDSFGFNQYDYVPSGIIVLRIKEFVWESRKEWKDAKTRPLEECLNSFIRGLYKAVLIEKARHKKFERERESDREKYRQQEELQRQEQEEAGRFQELEAGALSWHKSQIIKSYIESSKKAYVEKNGKIEEGGEFDLWVKWAQEYVEQINPCKIKCQELEGEK